MPTINDLMFQVSTNVEGLSPQIPVDYVLESAWGFSWHERKGTSEELVEEKEFKTESERDLAMEKTKSRSGFIRFEAKMDPKRPQRQDMGLNQISRITPTGRM